LQYPAHAGIQTLVADLNRHYRAQPALHDADSEPLGFQWLQPDNAADNAYAFVRRARAQGHHLVCVANMSPVPRWNFRVGLPREGTYVELLNSDAEAYGGSGLGNLGGVYAQGQPWDGQPASAELTLPPLSVVWLVAG
jgi:1,4-alpha-glucan branching enzyme